MVEGPYSRYTRARTWAALYSQHLNAGYALVPLSATNNSIAVIRCADAKAAQATMADLLAHVSDCEAYFASGQAADSAPAILQRAQHAVVLARSSDYYRYHLADQTALALVICGLHDSYLQLPVWEMRTNRCYEPRTTSVDLASPDFARLRRTQFGHAVLVGTLINGDATASALLASLPPRTQSRINGEVRAAQKSRARGRPLAFLTEAKRQEIGSKISAGLRRYHAQKRQQRLHAR